MAVINNGYLGMVRQWQQFFYGGRYSATPMRGPDFVKLADAHGLPGCGSPIARPDRERRSPRRALRRTPSVIDFRVEQEDSVYPMVPAGADLHDMIRRPSPIVETSDS